MGAIQPSRFLTDSGSIRPGVSRVVKVPNPAAGADWTQAVPGGVMWKILSGQATLTTSAAVATRLPQIQLTSAGVNVGVYSAAGSVAASLTTVVSFTQKSGSSILLAGATSVPNPLPDYPLVQGDTFGSLTGAIQAADQWSAIAFVVAEYYITNPLLSEIARERAEYELELINEIASGQQPHIGA